MVASQQKMWKEFFSRFSTFDSAGRFVIWDYAIKIQRTVAQSHSDQMQKNHLASLFVKISQKW